MSKADKRILKLREEKEVHFGEGNPPLPEVLVFPLSKKRRHNLG